MDRRYITKLDTVENMKRNAAPLSLKPPCVGDWNYPGKEFIFLVFVPDMKFGVLSSSTSYDYMKEIFGIEDVYNGILMYMMDVDNQYHIECAKYIEQFYNEAIGIYGQVPKYLDSFDDEDFISIVHHLDKIENYINEKCESNIELRKLYELS